MKKLTNEEFSKAPKSIQFIYALCLEEIPLGVSTFEAAIKKYPEYFPDEIEYRRKRSLVPETVNNEYIEELFKLREEIFKNMPESKGIFHWISHPDEFEEWNKKYNECREKMEPLEKALHEKFYEKYGLSKISNQLK